MTPDKIAELRVKHLEMLQGLITRMAGYGASFKSYCITVVTAVIGFAFTLHRPAVAALALLVIDAASPARALPSFARQTGQPCGTCHTSFPGLTPFGRRFKLLGYTTGGGLGSRFNLHD